MTASSSSVEREGRFLSIRATNSALAWVNWSIVAWSKEGTPPASTISESKESVFSVFVTASSSSVEREGRSLSIRATNSALAWVNWSIVSWSKEGTPPASTISESKESVFSVFVTASSSSVEREGRSLSIRATNSALAWVNWSIVSWSKEGTPPASTISESKESVFSVFVTASSSSVER